MKIIQIGNSTGVIIPKPFLENMGLKAGAEVVIEQDPSDNSLVIVKKGDNIKRLSVNPKLLETLEKVNKHYGAALKELARR